MKRIKLILNVMLTFNFVCHVNSMDIVLLHTNDIHGRFEQTSVDSNACKLSDANLNKCYGGFARLSYKYF